MKPPPAPMMMPPHTCKRVRGVTPPRAVQGHRFLANLTGEPLSYVGRVLCLPGRALRLEFLLLPSSGRTRYKPTRKVSDAVAQRICR